MTTHWNVAYLFAAVSFLAPSLTAVTSMEGHPRREPAPCEYTATDTATLDAAGVSAVRIDAGPGTVHIVGTSANTIHMKADRCASRRDLLENLSVRMQRNESEAAISVSLPQHLFSATEGSVATVELLVEMPRTLDLRIERSSGDVRVSSVHRLELNSSLGDVRIEDVASDVSVHSGPGDLTAFRTGGSLAVEKRVGSIEVHGVEGTVRISKPHTGAVDLRDVKGSITIEGEQSGDVSVSNVGGDVAILRLQTGQVRSDRIRGQLQIPKHPE